MLCGVPSNSNEAFGAKHPRACQPTPIRPHPYLRPPPHLIFPLLVFVSNVATVPLRNDRLQVALLASYTPSDSGSPSG